MCTIKKDAIYSDLDDDFCTLDMPKDIGGGNYVELALKNIGYQTKMIEKLNDTNYCKVLEELQKIHKLLANMYAAIDALPHRVAETLAASESAQSSVLYDFEKIADAVQQSISSSCSSEVELVDMYPTQMEVDSGAKSKNNSSELFQHWQQRFQSLDDPEVKRPFHVNITPVYSQNNLASISSPAVPKILPYSRTLDLNVWLK